MNLLNSELNLARKWRPKQFGQIVGQDFAVRMLKNSLYLNKVFPVYIFSGQRGCGKTSTARIFAAAINCEKLADFRLNPKEIDIPCQECSSCVAMQNASHPDFIEIDAASHTGVDNVRQIIESAAHMPLSGSTKIYLIDEAHMLSKAAFNAFLKVLEEPPASVRFVLATTELVKIPDTVRSRAFQVFFNSVENKSLFNHLKFICDSENISIESEALDLIINESEGSIRDAQNLLERVRFLNSNITKDLVFKLLGRVSEEILINLFNFIVEQRPRDIILYLSSISFSKLSAQSIWDMLIDLCRILIWKKFGVEATSNSFLNYDSEIDSLIKKCSLSRLSAIMQFLWSQEELFSKTSKKHIFLETVLIQLSEQVNVADLDELLNEVKKIKTSDEVSNDLHAQSVKVVSQQQISNTSSNKVINNDFEIHSDTKVEENKNSLSEQWSRFLLKISDLKNPMLDSIFRQMRVVDIDKINKKINLFLPNKNRFFEETLKEFEEKISNLLNEVFEEVLGFNLVETSGSSSISLNPSAAMEAAQIKKKSIPDAQVKADQFNKAPTQKYQFLSKSKEKIDFSDSKTWPKSALLAKYFSGRIEKAE